MRSAHHVLLRWTLSHNVHRLGKNGSGKTDQVITSLRLRAQPSVGNMSPGIVLVAAVPH